VTGNNPSEIYGTIKSSIQGADFYLLNPNGVLFGENVSLDITGSFYATTANYIDFADGYRMDTSVNPNMTFTSAAPSDFGFTTSTPGKIEVNGSNLSVNGSETISLISGDIDLDNGAALEASDGIINIASVASSGVVTVTPDTIKMSGFTELGDVSFKNTVGTRTKTKISTTDGSAGHIVIRSGTLTLDDGSTINADSKNSGTNNYSKNIDIATKKIIKLDNKSTITNNVYFFSEADTKGISLYSNNITIDNGSRIESSAKIRSEGNSGGIQITSDITNISNESEVSANTSGSGSGGDIVLNVNNLSISNYAKINTTTSSSGHAGNTSINAKNITIVEGGNINSTSNEAGNAGNIEVNANNLLIIGPELSDSPFDKYFDLTGIFTEKYNKNSLGGNITIVSSNIVLDSRGAILADNYGTTTGGDIKITSNGVNVLRGSLISTLAANNGNGGNIDILANEINVSGAHEDYKLIGGFPVFDVSAISTIGETQTADPGRIGNVNLSTSSLNIVDGGKILTSGNSYSTTLNTGNITINARNINVLGYSQFHYDTYKKYTGDNDYDILRFASSAISSDLVYFAQNSGTLATKSVSEPTTSKAISITSEKLLLDNGGYINSGTTARANSHDINVSTNLLSISGGSYITTSSISNSVSNAGDINIKAKKILIEGSDSKSVTSGIYTNVDRGGKGGDITIATNYLKLDNETTINSSTLGNNKGGNITINSNDRVYVANNSRISAEASKPSSADAGDITINTGILALDNGLITTSAISGKGGNIYIAAKNIFATENSDINAESEQSVSGQRVLNTDYNVSSSLAKLSDKPTNTANFSTNACAYNTDARSSFSVSNNLSNVSINTYMPSNIYFTPISGATYSNQITKSRNYGIYTANNDTTSLFLPSNSVSECVRHSN
jgi:hypothetical protein